MYWDPMISVGLKPCDMSCGCSEICLVLAIDSLKGTEIDMTVMWRLWLDHNEDTATTFLKGHRVYL